MLGIVYSIVSYVAFLASFVYFAWFTDGIGVPRTVDSGTAGSPLVACVVDAGLLLLFGLQHSIMARARFKRTLTRIVPPALERATFVLASSVVLVVLMWLWQPIPVVLWHVDNRVVAGVLWVINIIGWVAAPLVTFLIDHFHLVGLKQAFSAFRRVSLRQQGFVTPLLYRYVRHPMMSALLLGFWVTPEMTVGHLLLSLGMTVYIVVGVHFEERSLVAELGGAYQQYMAVTPRFVPLRRGGASAAQRAEVAAGHSVGS